MIRSTVSSVPSCFFPFKAHSQTIPSLHPISLIFFRTTASRSRFFRILFFQNSFRVSGIRNNGQSCPCQKQPCTNRTAWYFGNTCMDPPDMSRGFSLSGRQSVRACIRPPENGRCSNLPGLDGKFARVLLNKLSASRAEVFHRV